MKARCIPTHPSRHGILATKTSILIGPTPESGILRLGVAKSQWGQSRPNWAIPVMSGLLPIATELRTSWEVPFVLGIGFNAPIRSRRADLPFDDLINYPISRTIAVNSN
jgi:hypothetical protein